MKTPKGTKYKRKLETGRIICFREPTWSDQRMASEIATKDGVFKPMRFVEEMIQLMCIGLFRKNGEPVDISNKEKFFDDILTYGEANQLIQHPNSFGLSLEKKSPKVEPL